MEINDETKTLMTTALQATDGDRDLLRDVVETFLDEYPTLLVELERAIPLADYATIQRAGHTIKGTLRMFGNTSARVLASELENMGKTTLLVNAEAKLARLKNALKSLRTQLEIGLSNLDNAT